MANKKLELVPTLSEAFELGIKNLFPLILALILYLITIWIPYLNVGTTVGMYRLIIDMTKGEAINPLAIFDKDNFTQIGDFFLLLAFLGIGVSVAFCFMIVPGFVLGIAWGYAIYLLIEKKVLPLEALSLSYKATYGEKWTIFLIEILVTLLIGIVCVLLALIPKVGVLFSILAGLVGCSFAVAVEAVLYRHFSAKVDDILGAAPAQPAPAAEE
ncbi:MAG: hypothetical protein IJV01_06955 [Bacteroidales bacterium]|nr:hypothetical protein [Bacteroidales bacterium]